MAGKLFVWFLAAATVAIVVNACSTNNSKGKINLIKRQFRIAMRNIDQLEKSLKGNCFCKPTCKKGWNRFRNHCYLISTDYRTWNRAKMTCKRKGGVLAYITNEAENNWLLNMIKARSWIGGNDIYREGKWQWDTIRKPLYFTKWDPDYKEPNGGRKENCAELYPKGYKNSGHWNDSRCTLRLRYICKRKLVRHTLRSNLC